MLEASPAPMILEAHDVSRRYGRSWAVRRVSLAFAEGSVTAILGDNGAGKSTLLQLLAGLTRPSEGEVVSFGESLAQFPSATVRRKMAVLQHLPGIYSDLSGRENLTFFTKLYGRAPDGVAEQLAFVGLAEAADRAARTYSRGMVQRLALARVMLQGADLWLLDEPTTGLDARGVAMLADVIAKGKAEGKTIVAVTHDLPALGPSVDRVVRLAGGRLVVAA